MHRRAHLVPQVCPQLSECLETIYVVWEDLLNASARVCTHLKRLMKTLQTRSEKLEISDPGARCKPPTLKARGAQA